MTIVTFIHQDKITRHRATYWYCYQFYYWAISYMFFTRWVPCFSFCFLFFDGLALLLLQPKKKQDPKRSHMFIFYTHSHIQSMFLDLRRWVDVGGRNLSDNNRENGCERQNTFFGRDLRRRWGYVLFTVETKKRSRKDKVMSVRLGGKLLGRSIPKWS